MLRFRSRVLRFRDLDASFSRFGCFVLRSSFSSASFSKLPNSRWRVLVIITIFLTLWKDICEQGLSQHCRRISVIVHRSASGKLTVDLLVLLVCGLSFIPPKGEECLANCFQSKIIC